MTLIAVRIVQDSSSAAANCLILFGKCWQNTCLQNKFTKFLFRMYLKTMPFYFITLQKRSCFFGTSTHNKLVKFVTCWEAVTTGVLRLAAALPRAPRALVALAGEARPPRWPRFEVWFIGSSSSSELLLSILF